MMSRFSLIRPLNNSRGSAIMFSMFLMSLLVFIAMEVSKDTVVEYQGSLNSIRRVQAYYAAKSCTDLSLLRIKAYQQAAPLAKSLPNPSLIEFIWQFPLSWPIAAPSAANQTDKDAIKKTVESSTFKHNFSAKITGQSSRIDINDLASPSEGIRTKTRQQILNIFQSKLRDQSDWSKKYQNYRFETLIFHIADWIDTDSVSQAGGDEGSYYSNLRSPAIPPNQPFKTIEEIHMVKDMEDEIFDVLVPMITIYGTKGININYAEADLLKALDPRITDEIAGQVIQRRDDQSLGGRFKDEKEFLSFLAGFGINDQDFNKDKVPMYFDQEINFYISCIGNVGRITREMTSVVYDFKKVQTRLNESLVNDSLPPNDPCQGKELEDLYKCQCQSETDPVKNKTCVDQKRTAASAKPNPATSPADPPMPGPPYVIFQDIK